MSGGLRTKVSGEFVVLLCALPADWRTSVWIEIDPQLVVDNIISSQDLAARQNAAGDHLHKRMPQIEVAHLGPVPRAAFKRAFLVREGDSELRALISSEAREGRI